MSTDASNQSERDAADFRNDTARRIVREVRLAARIGQTRLTKVTSLLHAFRAPGRAAKFNDVKRELEGRGVRLDSGWTEIRRTGVLELSLSVIAEQRAAQPDADDTIQVSRWGPNSVGQERSLTEDEAPATNDVLWFNVDPPPAPAPDSAVLHGRQETRRTQFPRSQRTVSPDQGLRGGADPTAEVRDHRVRHVLNRLEGLCPGLDEEMVRDLLRRDEQPKVDTYGDENDGIRGISAVAVIARELPGTADDSDEVSEELVFQLVEMIVADRWIVTCWHPSRIHTGTTDDQPGHPILREPFLSHVRYRWLNQMTPQPKTPGDLGLYLTRSLIDTYGASHRTMERWVESWEVDFAKSLSSSEKAKKLNEAAGEISNSLSMAGEFRRRLTAFQHARWTTTDKSWFPALSDRDLDIAETEDQSRQLTELDKSLRSADEKLALLSQDIRADMDLLMLHSTATQQEATERLQGYVAKVTGLVLVPTLVAGLFGANTRLPGGGSWMGFELMLILMVLSAVAVYFVIRKLVQ